MTRDLCLLACLVLMVALIVAVGFALGATEAPFEPMQLPTRAVTP